MKLSRPSSVQVGMLIAVSSFALGAGTLAGMGLAAPIGGAPQPIYGARELADMELAVLEANVTVAYWTAQEDKASNMVQLLASQPAQTPRDSILLNLATSSLYRASGAKIEAGLVLERTKQRLDGMRQINEPFTAAAPH